MITPSLRAYRDLRIALFRLAPCDHRTALGILRRYQRTGSLSGRQLRTAERLARRATT